MNLNKRVCMILPLLILLFFCSGIPSLGMEKASSETVGLISAALPNPAAAYCAKLGYRVEGDICIFPDGTKAKVWDFYRGKSGKKWSYCGTHGGKIEKRSEKMGSWTAEYAVCKFNNGTECLEQDYIDGRSGPGKCRRYSMAKGCVK